jgi:NAD(P)-dependent dehydrogenase (short-subunit alcohol dehydrogenase family)
MQPGGQMQVDLDGRVALVTGGTRGLGRQMVSALARCGADVIVTGRRQDACDEVAAEVQEESGRTVVGVACHVGHWNEIDGLAETAFERFGHVDILVNNAGIAPTYDGIQNVTEDLFDKTLAVNLKGPFRLCAVIGSRMAEGAGGSIINVSSTAAIRPRPHIIPYAAAKAGLNVMTEGLAYALGPAVRVNCVMCGPFQTDITVGWDWEAFNKKVKEFGLRRIGQPEEIVGAVLYFASDASSYTTGAILTVNGGEP